MAVLRAGQTSARGFNFFAVIPAKAGIQGHGLEPIQGDTKASSFAAWHHRRHEGPMASHLVVYIEFLGTMPEAIQREKQLKKWRRAWKVELIERTNPQWRDLCEEIRR